MSTAKRSDRDFASSRSGSASVSSSASSDSETSDSDDPLSHVPPPSKKAKLPPKQNQKPKSTPPPSQPAAAKPSASNSISSSGVLNSNFPYLSSPPSSAPLSSTGRPFTVTIALPGSIISNVQSGELRSYIAGQIARSASIFNIDEIVIFNENPSVSIKRKSDLAGEFRGPDHLDANEADVFLGRILQYLETPQYLRKLLFPVHPSLRFAGLLNPLDLPSHLRANEPFQFREGVVVKRPTKKGKKEKDDDEDESAPSSGSSWVNVGLLNEVLIDRALPPGTRVTVEITNLGRSEKKLYGRVVSPSILRTKYGMYWGYTTRLANQLSDVWTECKFKGGYDLSIGTSERGLNIQDPEVIRSLKRAQRPDDPEFAPSIFPRFNHLLIVFGGVDGIEAAFESDQKLKADKVDQLFDFYINAAPAQGSRTIRTEEAIPIVLAALQPWVKANPTDEN